MNDHPDRYQCALVCATILKFRWQLFQDDINFSDLMFEGCKDHILFQATAISWFHVVDDKEGATDFR